MANPESKQLAIDVIARVSKLEKEMAKAKGITSKNFGDMEKRGKQFQTRMAGIGKAAFAGFAAGIAGVGVGGAVAALRQVASSVADIRNEAARAGVTTRVFQEWEAVAVKAAAKAEREAEAVRRLIGELEHELRLVGATDLQRETANALRQAGAAATAEQEAKIVSLIAAIHAEEEATRKATEAAQELRDVGRDVLGGFINDMVQGKSAADALASALQNVANRLLNSGLDSLFGGGGALLGSTFSLNLRSAK